MLWEGGWRDGQTLCRVHPFLAQLEALGIWVKVRVLTPTQIQSSCLATFGAIPTGTQVSDNIGPKLRFVYTLHRRWGGGTLSLLPEIGAQEGTCATGQSNWCVTHPGQEYLLCEETFLAEKARGAQKLMLMYH